jgi:class 3 adenylate cyclase
MTLEKQDSCAVLFADISGSTRLYVDVGDDRAREIVAATLDRWSTITVGSGGQVIQLRGDGMLCIFPTADAALTAAIGMRDLPYQDPLSMHAGMHAGPVLREGEQLYGDVVNTAARMADIAKRFEIVMTEAAQSLLAESSRTRLRLIRKVPVKGKSEPMDIYLLANDKQALTDYRPPLQTRSLQTRLKLRYALLEFAVDSGSRACLIGRDEDCQLKVDHRLVSRRHASIECVSGRYFLQDHSTNGTYVDDGGGHIVLVHRELYQLKGRGVLSLGIDPKDNPEHLIVFATHL